MPTPFTHPGRIRILLPLALVLAAGGPRPALAACATSDAGTICDGPDDVTLAQAIGGGGQLSKAGSGTLTLSGPNTYTGGNSLTEGTLALAGVGTLGAAGGALVVQGGRLDLGGTGQSPGLVRLTGGAIDNGTLQGSVYDLQAGAVGATLAGAGPLVKSTDGVVTLSGANTHSGGTRLDAGTLAITGAGRIGAPEAALVVQGGTLDLGGTAQTTGPVVLTAGAIRGGSLRGTIYDLEAGSVDAVLSGPAALTKRGDGTVVLTGANTYTGQTVVSEGVLQAGAANVLPAPSGLIVNGPGTLDLAGFDQTVASLNGTGRVSTGAANLTVGGDGTDAVFSGSLDGSGRLTKTGAGRLDLTGDGAFSGVLAVDAGRLRVSGNLGSAAAEVASGAVLEGVGTIGSLSLRGTLSPGVGAVGTLGVAGNAVLEAGSTFQVRATADGQADRLAVAGQAVLRGGQVDVQAQAGSYAANTRYTILTAAGGVQGQFGGVTSNLAFLTPSLAYAGNSVVLDLARNDVAYGSVGTAPNQTAAGRRVESLGSGAVYDAVGRLSAPQARTAFDALSGEVHASAVAGLVETGFLVREAILDRLRWSDGAGPACFGGPSAVSTRYGGVAPGAARREGDCRPDPEAGGYAPRTVGLWGQGFGAFGSTRAGTGTARLDRQTGGFVVGGDVEAADAIRVGAAAGYTETNLDVPLRGSSGGIESGFGSVYAGIGVGDLNLRLGGLYGVTGTDTRRAVAFAGFNDSTRASYGGSVAQGFGEVGLPLDAAGVTLEPFAGAATIRLAQDGFAETGGAASLVGAARSVEVTTATVGVRAEVRLDRYLGGLPILLRGLVGYRAASGDLSPGALLAFASGGSAVLTQGAPVDRQAAVVQVGLGWPVFPATMVGLSYAGQVGPRAQDHAARGNLTYRF